MNCAACRRPTKVEPALEARAAARAEFLTTECIRECEDGGERRSVRLCGERVLALDRASESQFYSPFRHPPTLPWLHASVSAPSHIASASSYLLLIECSTSQRALSRSELDETCDKIICAAQTFRLACSTSIHAGSSGPRQIPTFTIRGRHFHRPTIHSQSPRSFDCPSHARRQSRRRSCTLGHTRSRLA